MMSRKSLRSLGDLQQFLSVNTRSEIDGIPTATTANAETESPALPDNAPAPVICIQVTYNISATRIIRQFFTDNVLTHYLRADKPNMIGTLGQYDLDFTNIETAKDVVRLLAEAKIPTVKFHTYAPTATTAEDEIADASSERPAPVYDIESSELTNPVPADDLSGSTVEGDPTTLDQQINEPVEPATPNESNVDEYMGRRVLPVINTPVSAYPGFDPNAPTAIWHVATGQVFATYPNLAEAEAAYNASTSPRKHEFDLVQQVQPVAPLMELDGESTNTPDETSADADGPYTLMMREGARWDTLEVFQQFSAAIAYLEANTAPDTFNADDWALYAGNDEECDLSAVHAVTAVAAGVDLEEGTPSLAELEPAGDTLQPLTLDMLDVFADNPLPSDMVSHPAVAPVTALEDRTNRIAKIDHIVEFYKLLGMDTRSDLHQLSDEALDDLLFVLEQNNGGSIEAAAVIQAVEDRYARFIQSDTLALKMRALDTMGKQHFQHVQRITAALGDVTIGGMKGAAYHDQLKKMVSHISVVNDAVMDLGNLMGVRVSVDNLSGVMGAVDVAEGLPFNPKICMYVLEIFRSNIENLTTKSKITHEDLRRANTARIEAEAAVRRLREDAATSIEAARKREAYLNGLLADNASTYWVLRAPSGKYLSKIDPNATVRNARDLTLAEGQDNALRFPSRGRAISTMEQLAETSRFRKVTLSLRRVSEVEEN